MTGRVEPVTGASLASALEVLGRGAVLGLPTDTVYGLAVDPFVAGATASLFAAKERPTDVGIPVLVASLEQAESLVPPLRGAALALARRWWPGPVTIVLPRRSGFDADLGGDGVSVGLRLPLHNVPRWLCEQRGPLATTSANLHGHPPLTEARAVAAELGPSVALVLDGGPSAGGVASTVVDCRSEPPSCLREGSVPWPDVLRSLA